MVYTEKVKIGLKDVEKENFGGNKTILECFENAAGHQADILGYGINSIKKTHLSWVLLEWKVKIINRIKYGQELTINTWSRSIERCYGIRDFEIYDENNKLCVIATSKWLLVDTQKGTITRADEEMKKKYDSEPNRKVFGDEKLKKLNIPENYTNIIYYKILRKDIDLMGHLHNTYYLDLAYEALPEEIYQDRLFNNIRITYKKEIKLGTNVKCKYSYENDKHIVVLESEDEKVIHAIIELSY